jgi:hypothetical protein
MNEWAAAFCITSGRRTSGHASRGFINFVHTNFAHTGIGGIHVPVSSMPTQAGLDMLDLARQFEAIRSPRGRCP